MSRPPVDRAAITVGGVSIRVGWLVRPMPEVSRVVTLDMQLGANGGN